VEAYVRQCETKSNVGMIEQSLCHHLQTQLTEYYRLIAVLESQMAMGTHSGHQPELSNGNQDLGDEGMGLTLRRLDVWINEWRLRMRMMSVCVQGARGKIFRFCHTIDSRGPTDAQGGALVNLIHGYTDNGDPFVRSFTDQLLEEVGLFTCSSIVDLKYLVQVSKPFFATLHKWLFSGELYDPFSEFFVALDPDLAHVQYVHPSTLAGGIGQISSDGGFAGLGADADDIGGDHEGGLRLWEAKYQFQKDMLPMFVGDSFGRKACL
jgi:gamma-tubulin complex component 3